MKKLEDVEGMEREKAVFECDVNDPEAEVKWFKGEKVSALLHDLKQRKTTLH